MKYEERLVRNAIIVNLSKEGFSQESIGKMVNLGQRMVSTILSKFTNNAPLTLKSSGCPSGLSDSDLASLPFFLEKGAESYGFSGNYWTHRRVGYLGTNQMKSKRF